MTSRNRLGLGLGIALLILAQSPQTAADPAASVCLGCHQGDATTPASDPPGYAINPDTLKGSVHHALDCTDCHMGFTESNHTPKGTIKTPVSNACKGCHQVGSGAHKQMLAANPTLKCQSCHGAHAIKQPPRGGATCMGCHQNSFSMTMGDGSRVSLKVDPKDLQHSIHKGLQCVDCHVDMAGSTHPKRSFKTHRDLTLAMSESCKRCHFDKYTQELESAHYNIKNEASAAAPVCVDCHGDHGIQAGRSDKLSSARRCQTCHPDIYATYTKSVHGAALLSENNQDVPICSDCHTAHRIKDPTKSDFRNTVPEMCGNCHANKSLMKKYGLSTNILESYLESFHGVTLTFYKKDPTSTRHIAVCTDCHGIHNISKTKIPDATIVKANLLANCQRCHPGATENFPDTWISHYEPTLKSAPLVFIVMIFYKFFIPFMLVGLVLQIFLHLWRYAVNR